MTNFSTQCVTLMMIFVMVYAAPTKDPCKDRRIELEQIKEATKTALKHSLPGDLYVYKVSGSKTCLSKFFCLADESLKKAMKENSNSNKHLQKLKVALNVYTKNETCDLDVTELYSVTEFLNDIKLCVKYALGSNSNICPK